jgi:crotonobetainyl-CoA:carnitine CoA-transferase CaiB-like acyl-CoA transferase
LVELCAGVDVVIASSRPARDPHDRLGFDALSARNPRLIMVSLTPFGATGPYRDWHGYDINTGALGGINYYLGETDGGPLMPPYAIGEYEAGVNAAVAALVAVVTEAEGQHYDLAEADCWGMIQTGLAVVEYIFGGRLFERRGGGVRGGAYPNALFRCKDGLVRIICVQRREWLRFLELMGNPAWADDPRFQDRVQMNELYADELNGLVEQWMAAYTKEEVFAMCRDAGVPCGPLYGIDDVVEHPQLGTWLAEVDHPEVNGVRQAGAPYRLSETPVAVRRGAPRLGEHTGEALAAIGIEGEALESLRAAGVA